MDISIQEIFSKSPPGLFLFAKETLSFVEVVLVALGFKAPTFCITGQLPAVGEGFEHFWITDY